MLKKVFLIKIEPNNNNNKFYNMSELGDGNFKAEYGRVGNNPAVEIYPMSKWDKKYKEKLSERKGYKDKTYLFESELPASDSAPQVATASKITDKKVESLIIDLQKYASVSVAKDYIISSEKVTQKMIDEAQVIINGISAELKLKQATAPINKMLIDLFQVIPRKMKDVKSHILSGDYIDDLPAVQKLIALEQETLDVMNGQVLLNSKSNQTTDHKNILDIFGLKIEPASDKDIARIKKMMGSRHYQFRNAFAVINEKTQKRFDNHHTSAKNKKSELFWHGSRNENWWNIINTGLVLRPTNAVITGKMYGHGIYFANLYKKSLGYTSLDGSYWSSGRSNKAYLSLLDVHVGNQLVIKNHDYWCKSLDYKGLKQKGDYDSVYAPGGYDLINDEFIVYQEQQTTTKFLVEVGK